VRKYLQYRKEKICLLALFFVGGVSRALLSIDQLAWYSPIPKPMVRIKNTHTKKRKIKMTQIRRQQKEKQSKGARKTQKTLQKWFSDKNGTNSRV
jgi:hypothetical protein